MLKLFNKINFDNPNQSFPIIKMINKNKNP